MASGLTLVFEKFRLDLLEKKNFATVHGATNLSASDQGPMLRNSVLQVRNPSQFYNVTLRLKL